MQKNQLVLTTAVFVGALVAPLTAHAAIIDLEPQHASQTGTVAALLTLALIVLIKVVSKKMPPTGSQPEEDQASSTPQPRRVVIPTEPPSPSLLVPPLPLINPDISAVRSLASKEFPIVTGILRLLSDPAMGRQLDGEVGFMAKFDPNRSFDDQWPIVHVYLLSNPVGTTFICRWDDRNEAAADLLLNKSVSENPKIKAAA
jgi:hypothetical protein